MFDPEGHVHIVFLNDALNWGTMISGRYRIKKGRGGNLWCNYTDLFELQAKINQSLEYLEFCPPSRALSEVVRAWSSVGGKQSFFDFHFLNRASIYIGYVILLFRRAPDQKVSAKMPLSIYLLLPHIDLEVSAITDTHTISILPSFARQFEVYLANLTHINVERGDPD